MAGPLTDLGVAARLAGRALRRRLAGEVEPAPDLDAWRQNWDAVLAAVPEGVVAAQAWIDIPADQPPWIASGLRVAPGDELSWFMDGRVELNRTLDIHLGPELQLWARVSPDGQVFRGTRASHSFTADRDGELQFGNYFPNTWKNRRGELALDERVYRANRGAFRVLVIRWLGTAQDGLATLRAAAPEHTGIASELERLALGDTVPPGWHYLWRLGAGEIYRAGQIDGTDPCIHCRTERDVGILQRDVDLPLTPETEISWRWRVDELPSTLREDTLPTHDYLSIAVEFDNGRDITYYWSATLPEGTGYDCPLPNWRKIEFHVVVRSGSAQLGHWLDERRNLYRDYEHYMGEPPPRITRIWFIANSIFQRGRGACDYADIRLHGPDGEVRLL